jgi:pyruvate/2-oxoacid:ferredoxin oxidoreductase beta subunit
MSLDVRSIKDVPREEYYASGHRTCAGCGPAIACKLASKAAGPRTVILGATGCMYVANTSYYLTPWVVPWMHTQLGAGGSAGAGTAAAFRALMRKGKMRGERINVIALCGDGSTSDIGMNALSGGMLSGQDFLYICYDNQSYANTGIQASGTTPWGAWTTFTPPGRASPTGNVRLNKNLARLVATGHPNVEYVATASIAFPFDFMTKVRKGLAVDGPAFIQVQTPCPKGWRFDSSRTIEVGRLSVETGSWFLYEVVKGDLRLTYRPRELLPVAEYVRAQGRFAHLSEADIETIQKRVDEACREIGLGPSSER